MPIQKVLSEGRVPVKIYTQDIAENAVQQLANIATLPFIHRQIAAMPDVHLGIGATVGSVIPTQGAIIPAAVGVDIGCGMNAVRLSLKAKDLPDNLKQVRSQVERDVPAGFGPTKRSTGKPRVWIKSCRAWPKFSPSIRSSKPTGAGRWVLWAEATISSNCASTKIRMFG